MNRAASLPKGLERQFVDAPPPPAPGDAALFMLPEGSVVLQVTSDLFIEGNATFVRCAYRGRDLNYPIPIDRLVQMPAAFLEA